MTTPTHHTPLCPLQREIQKQHSAVCDMMKVAASVSCKLLTLPLLKPLPLHPHTWYNFFVVQIKKFPDKTKADLARESLAKYKFPESFSPPYNPMVAMGNLNISKCRIMDSKKVKGHRYKGHIVRCIDTYSILLYLHLTVDPLF